MKLILVESGATTAVYHAFYKNKLCTYKTAEGVEGLLQAIGVEITETKVCDNPKEGKIIDPQDGFPYHIDNLPGAITVSKKKSVKKKPPEDVPVKSGNAVKKRYPQKKKMK